MLCPSSDIFLDGEPRGKTPATLDVPGDGSHLLRLDLDGYQSWSVVPERRKPLPDPVHLQKHKGRKAAGNGKIRKFFKGIFQ